MRIESRWAWPVALVVILQTLVIFGYYQREISPFPPGYFDQAGYLTQVYDLTDRILRTGWTPFWQFLVSGGSPQGILLPIYGAIAETVYPGRLTALGLNILAFLVLQGAVFTAVRHQLRSPAAGLVAVGMVLSLRAIWVPYGGMFDYRPDFFALCAYGTWVSAVLRSDLFLDRHWSLIAGAVAIALCLDRYFALIYLLGVTLGFAISLLLLPGPDTRVRVRNMLASNAIMVSALAPFIAISWPAIWAYYGVGHLTGPEKYIRAAEQGVFTFRDNLLFYPISILYTQIGVAAGVFWALVCVTGLFLWWPRGKCRPRLLELAFLSGTIFGPLVVLTINVAKSPVVGGIVVVPIILLFVMLFGRLTIDPQARTGQLRFSSLCLAAGLLVFWHQAVKSNLSTDLSSREWRRAVLALNHEAERRKIKEPRVFFDGISVLFNTGTLTAFGYEQTGLLTRFQPSLGPTLFAIQKKDAWTALDNSDFAVLSGTIRNHPYPFYASMLPLWKDLRDRVTKEFVPMGTFEVGDASQNTALYVRPRPVIYSPDPSWLGPTGTKVRIDARDLAIRSVVRITGSYPASYLRIQPKVTAFVDDASIPAKLAIEGERYTIDLDFGGLRSTSKGMLEADLVFEGHFVPKDIGLNEDSRELVLWAPYSVRFIQ